MSTVSKVAAAIALAGTVACVGIGVSSADSAPAGPAPRVAVIGLGGTIAGTSDRRTDLETYRPGTRPIAELVDSLRPEIGEIAAVSTEDFGQKGSGDYTVTDLYDLARRVESRLRDHDSVVVSTGSATMEELSYFLDLTVRSTKPVVVTGAMRPWTAIGSDGPVNLYNAIRLAASNRTTCFGTVIALNDQILPARDATKSDSTRVHTFTTREYGDLGTIDQAGIRLQRAPARVQRCDDPARWLTPFDLTAINRDTLPRVDIAHSYLDAPAESVSAAVDAGAEGIVFAGTPSPKQASAALATKGVVLVATNAYGSGAITVDPAMGVVSGGDLAPKKARLLLLLALATTAEHDQIVAWFRDYGNQQF
ncbi:asparaginase [Nocardia salmonicida]|uniref:asparaginase n=1 Tax=Nocardia salmonicida TaxID=53431 RepID=UPI002E2832B3|nr:asparaginase [Nocardia salmonicida]